MSWGEVKKVNSDLNVPLDERMDSIGNTLKQKVEYAYGIIPRGIVLTTIRKNSLPTNGVEMLNIKGTGYLCEFTAKGNGTYDSKIEVWIDKGTNNEQYYSAQSTDGSESGMRIQMSNDFSTGLSENLTNSLITRNCPIKFEQSLRIVGSAIGTTAASAYCLVSYFLV